MRKVVMSAATLLLASSALTSSWAGVPAEVANRLGKDLTPMGAEAGGSGDVPAWTGGLNSPPAGIKFDPKSQNPPNPFPGDKPRFTITPANMAQYADRLDDGHKAMLKTYADYKMNVYESRRTCAAPQYVYAATKNNAVVAGLTADGEGVTGGIMGAPFPIASNAMEIVWNQKLRFLPTKVTRNYATAPVQSNGSYNVIKYQDEAIIRWTDPSRKKAEDLANVSLMYIQNTVAPARLAGNVILVHESLNGTVEPRKAWSYNPGQRRTRRAPDISYDNPGFNTDAMSTSDAFTGFNGGLDRYNWTVRGRSVKFIPYNAYDLMNSSYVKLLKPSHLNQDLVRYEPHRVWTVEAVLKPGARHLYARRVLHLDEDSHGVVGGELYDGRGNLWRYQELHTVNFYHVPVCFPAAEIVYDVLGQGRYLAGSMIIEEKPINFFADELNESRYTPEALRTIGVR